MFVLKGPVTRLWLVFLPFSAQSAHFVTASRCNFQPGKEKIQQLLLGFHAGGCRGRSGTKCLELIHLWMSSESEREVVFVQTRQILSFALCISVFFFCMCSIKNSNIIIGRHVWVLFFLPLSHFESLWTHFSSPAHRWKQHDHVSTKGKLKISAKNSYSLIKPSIIKRTQTPYIEFQWQLSRRRRILHL